LFGRCFNYIINLDIWKLLFIIGCPAGDLHPDARFLESSWRFELQPSYWCSA